MKKFIILCSLVISAITGYGNNIQVSNVTVLSGTNQIQFDISWDNSWRSDVLQNWDAAWVFMKYRDIDGKWKHLPFTNQAKIVPPGYNADIVTDSTGALLYRNVSGSGTSTMAGIKLGIPSQFALGVFDIKLFGIEMVYIPTGPFWVGDFGASVNSYGAGLAARISTSGSFNDPISNLLLGIGNSSCCNGYNNYYCMKYEISQGAYRDFLNSLTYPQQGNRTTNPPNSAVGTNAFDNSGIARTYIEIATSGVSTGNTTPAVYGCDGSNNNIFNEAGDGEWVACNYLSWPDLAAYLSWACLAPMTEFQYEKICRGPQQPVGGEYAWGTSQVSSNVYTLANAGYTNESINNLSINPNEGNANYFVTNPNPIFNAVVPLRTGIFATATSNRISSGGSFFGAMDMSGSMWERVITTANTNGLNFMYSSGQSINGTGILTNGGNALTNGNWPGSHITLDGSIDGLTNALGLMYRGGSSNFAATEMRVSNRTAAYVESGTGGARYIDQGGRGVRNL
jgi:formylglycine-generating enzyme required for sulfatase activity